MRKVLKWTGIVLLSPIILFIIVCILLYIPPLQNFIVKEATAYASKATGMEIGIKRISLSFPLNLVVQGAQVIDRKDTLLSVDRLQVNVRLLPLLKQQVEVDGIELKRASVNTAHMIEGMRLEGTLGEFFIESHGVDLKTEEVIVNQLNLKNTYLKICLNDTTETPKDTTQTQINWKFRLETLDIEDLGVGLQMPADSLDLSARISRATLTDGHINLKEQAYQLADIRIKEGSLNYDSGTLRSKTGFDPSHISLRDIQIGLDSLYYRGKDIKANIRTFSMLEQSGLEIVSLNGKIHSDSTSIFIPGLDLKTQHSEVVLSAIADWSTLEALNRGGIQASLSAYIGKQDIMLLAGKLPEKFVKEYPFRPLSLRTELKGNLQRIDLNELKCELPGAFSLSAQGKAENVLDSLYRSAEIDFHAETGKLDFLLALMENSPSGSIAIPPLMKLTGKGSMDGPRYQADLHFKEGKGEIVFNGSFDERKMAYSADLSIDSLQINDFLPQDSIYGLSAQLSAEGEGLDFFSTRTKLDAQLAVQNFQYATYNLSGLQMKASLAQSSATVTLEGDNPLFALQARVEAILHKQDVLANLSMKVPYIDWQKLHLTQEAFKTALNFDLQASSNLKDEFRVDGSISEIRLITPKRTYTPKDLIFGAGVKPDSTEIDLQAGDLRAMLRGGKDLPRLLEETTAFSNELSKQLKAKRIDQNILKTLLPVSCLQITAGSENPVGNYLASSGISFKEFFLDVDTSPEEGINGDAHIYALRTDSLQIDTIRFDIRQDTTGVKMLAKVINGPQNQQVRFTATAEAAIYESSAELLLKYLNEKGETGVLLGVRAQLEERGIGFHFFPEEPTLVFRPFKLNKNNYIFMADDKHVRADVSLFDKKGTGLKLYSLPDTTALQDIALEIRRVEIGEVMEVMPYMPDIQGLFSAEAHFTQTETSLQLATDLRIDSLTYEKEPVGNIMLGAVYLPGEKDTHYLDAYLSHNGTEVMTMGGSYHADDGGGKLNAEATLEHFPLSIANAFIPEHMAELTGDLDGELTVKGNPSNPIINGSIVMDSASVYIAQAGAYFRFEEEPLRVENNKLIFNKFDIYTRGKTPFTIDGDVDFSDFSNMTADLKLDAVNYELLNAPRTKQSILYGKVFVNFNSTVRGPLDALVMRGNIILQGNTNVTYVLTDSPLTVQDRLGDLVTFVNFADTTQNVQEEIPKISLGGMDMLMTVQIDPAVQVNVDLSADRENRIELEGGGDLSLQYSPQGDLILTGRYTLTTGKLSYSVAVLSKDFTIQNGSYVDWSGNPLDPFLNITAIERTRTSVTQEGQSPRNVSFDVSISIKNQLEDLELVFGLAAPEDAAVQNELAAMSPEERGKLAVTMLVTGAYLGGSGGSGFNMDNALNSVLQGQISNIVGGALKTVDVSFGMEQNDGTDGSGKRTDLSLRFAKRFMNNRLSVIIGGKISTGEDVQGGTQPFIDDISLEWRLDNTGTRYIKLFHETNYESILEGEITETGAGVVLRRKMSKLGELFIFRKKKTQPQKDEK